MSDLTGKVILVTGAARGQGRAYALGAAEAGADLVICDMGAAKDTAVSYELSSAAELDKTAEDIRALGRKCVAGAADVTKEADLSALIESAVKQLGRIDGVVANAGINAKPAPSWLIEESDWDRVIDVDLKGVWLTCKTTIPHLMASGGGSIVMISSVGGLMGQPGLSGYIAAKHGVIGLMRSMANEVGDAGIRVNSICPGAVETPMVTNQATMDLFSGAEPGKGTIDTMVAALEPRVLLKPGFVPPEDMAKVATWLLSDDSRWITGVALPVDAGMVAKA